MLDHGLVDLHTHILPQLNDGSPEEGTSAELLQEARHPLLAGDCHNPTNRPPNLAPGRNVVARKLGEACLAAMDRNAARLTRKTTEEAVP